MGGGGRFAPSAEGVGGCEYRGNDSPEAASGQRGLSRDARSETLATAERGERDAGKRGETRGNAGLRGQEARDEGDAPPLRSPSSEAGAHFLFMPRLCLHPRATLSNSISAVSSLPPTFLPRDP